MRFLWIVCLLGALSVLGAAGCGGQQTDQEPQTPPETAAPSTETQSSAASEEEMFMAMQAQSNSIAQLGERLSELERQMNLLKLRADTKGAEAAAEYAKIRADWDKKFEQAKTDLQELKKKSGDALDEAQAALKKAVHDLTDAISDAKQKLSG